VQSDPNNTQSLDLNDHSNSEAPLEDLSEAGRAAKKAEQDAARKWANRHARGLAIVNTGDGFTWLSKNIEKDQALAREGWQRCRPAMTRLARYANHETHFGFRRGG